MSLCSLGKGLCDFLKYFRHEQCSSCGGGLGKDSGEGSQEVGAGQRLSSKPLRHLLAVVRGEGVPPSRGSAATSWQGLGPQEQGSFGHQARALEHCTPNASQPNLCSASWRSPADRTWSVA